MAEPRLTQPQAKRAPPTDDADRPLPQNLDAELSVLGAILQDDQVPNQTLAKVSEILDASNFFNAHHRIIFAAMMAMAPHTQLDILTLADFLQSKGKLEEAGGRAYISGLDKGVPKLVNLQHARIIKEKSLLCRVIFASDAAKEAAYDGGDSAAEISEGLRANVDGIASGENGHMITLYTPAQLTAMVSEAIECIAYPIAVRGMVALVDGAPKSAGKTTLFLTAIRACLRGDLFLNHATKRVPILLVTEENPRTVKAALQRADLCDVTADFHILPANLARVPWLQLAARIEQMCADLRIGWLLVDTFYAIAGLAGDDENKAGAASQALAPLRRIAGTLDAAVSLGRHTRKMGGGIGESGRGSSALTGDADIIAELKRLPGAHQLQRRQLEFTGRIEPGCFEIELSDGRYRIVEEQTEAADETEVLVAAIGISPTASVRELSKSTGIGRNRVPKLLGKAGWTYDADEGWKQVVAQ